MDEEIAYTRKLLCVLEEGIAVSGNKTVQKLFKKIHELLETESIRIIRSKDEYIPDLKQPEENCRGRMELNYFKDKLFDLLNRQRGDGDC